MKRRNFFKSVLLGCIALITSCRGLKNKSKNLTGVTFPSPKELRSGWAAMAAICAARGWEDLVYATDNEWLYHDGGGNWACLRFLSANQAVLIGHDHEYSETYYREAAKYFGEEETDLLKGAPEWWGFNLSPEPFGEWIGFIYGWDGQNWERSNYEKEDGFDAVNLKGACSINNIDLLKTNAYGAPGLNGNPPNEDALKVLVAANGKISRELLEATVPGWDIEAGIAAAEKFMLIEF